MLNVCVCVQILCLIINVMHYYKYIVIIKHIINNIIIHEIRQTNTSSVDVYTVNAKHVVCEMINVTNKKTTLFNE